MRRTSLYRLTVEEIRATYMPLRTRLPRPFQVNALPRLLKRLTSLRLITERVVDTRNTSTRNRCLDDFVRTLKRTPRLARLAFGVPRNALAVALHFPTAAALPV